MPSETRTLISDALRIHASFNSSKYSSLPSLVGRSKKDIFLYLKDKVWARIQKWSKHPFSKVGREIMVKSVGQAIPNYCMNVFMLPTTLTDEI